MKITVSTYDGDYAGYIVKADMRIRGMSIDLDKVREIDINAVDESNGNDKTNGKKDKKDKKDKKGLNGHNGKRYGTLMLENGTYLNYDKDEIEGSVTISVPGIREEMTFNWNDDKISHINSDWW